MSISQILIEDILEDIRRGDHIVFGINAEGVHPDTNVGYSFVNRVIEEYVTDFKSQTTRELGTVVSVESDEYSCWFHGIVTHGIEMGWPENEEPWLPNSYRSITEALNELEEQFSPNLPFKSLWLGRGKQIKIGEVKGTVVKTMQAMANSEADLKVYIDGDKIYE